MNAVLACNTSVHELAGFTLTASCSAGKLFCPNGCCPEELNVSPGISTDIARETASGGEGADTGGEPQAGTEIPVSLL